MFKKKTKERVASIEPMDIEAIKNHEDIIELFKEKNIERYNYISKKKTILEGNVINKDITNIISVILEDFDTYKEELELLLNDSDYKVRIPASILCFRTNTSLDTATLNIKKASKDKGLGVVFQECKKIWQIYKKGNLSPYEGFENEE